MPTYQQHHQQHHWSHCNQMWTNLQLKTFSPSLFFRNLHLLVQLVAPVMSNERRCDPTLCGQASRNQTHLPLLHQFHLLVELLPFQRILSPLFSLSRAWFAFSGKLHVKHSNAQLLVGNQGLNECITQVKTLKSRGDDCRLTDHFSATIPTTLHRLETHF